MLGLGLGAALGYLLAQQKWAFNYLDRQDVRKALAEPANRLRTGLTYQARQETEAYEVTHSIEDGIERIAYRPRQARFEAPILFAHGMWHGAWCWRLWQGLFAEWGWESVAYSLPGHAGSPVQRPIPLCTLDYYLGFLKEEVARLPRRPVLIGHSMGGALTQWYLKLVGDDLPAAVLAAPWPHRATYWDGLRAFLLPDPLGMLLVLLHWSATPLMRSPQSAARLLIGPKAVISPQELHARVGPESIVALLQHLPRYWSPPENLHTPLLVAAGGADTMLPARRLQDTARFYRADFYLAEEAGHNLQMEHNYRQTAAHIHDWLIQQDMQ